jgi:RecJ-like exonuclease
MHKPESVQYPERTRCGCAAHGQADSECPTCGGSGIVISCAYCGSILHVTSEHQTAGGAEPDSKATVGGPSF